MEIRVFFKHYSHEALRLLRPSQAKLLIILLIVITRGDLPALVPHRRHALALGGFVVTDPVAGDLAAVGMGEVEADLVGALELDVLSGKDEVGDLGWAAGGDGGGFLLMF